MASKQRLILLTNDDGIHSPGLKALRERFADWGQVFVVAPSEERSASSHSLTIHHPIRILEVGADAYALTGTPADCVVMAMRKILPRLPDLVISGINDGPNLGDDVVYSGTVAGAREAAMWGVPALAVSRVERREAGFQAAAQFVYDFVADYDLSSFPDGIFFNINVPPFWSGSFRFTRQGSKRVVSAVEEKEDPRGRAYYWIGRDLSEIRVEADTDYKAIEEGLISVTPLKRDHTDYGVLESLERWVGKAGTPQAERA